MTLLIIYIFQQHADHVNTPNTPAKHLRTISVSVTVFLKHPTAWVKHITGHAIKPLSTTFLPSTSEQGLTGSAGLRGQPVSKQQNSQKKKDFPPDLLLKEREKNPPTGLALCSLSWAEAA